MKVFYVLVLTIYFFEGFIIQCNANEVENEQYFPDELIGEILAKAGLQKTKEVAQAQMKSAGYAIRRIIETRTIVIRELKDDAQPQMIEVEGRGEMYLVILSYTKLMSLFEQFGSHARKIYIAFGSMNKKWRHEINEKIINRYADRFTELYVTALNDTGIWEEMSSGQGDIRFPNVEKFCWCGSMGRNKFDVNTIFPMLKYFSLMGTVADTNCLTNVTNLKELNLMVSIGTIQEHQLGRIFKNNQQISKLVLNTYQENPIKRETLHSIEYLNNLKALKINRMGSNFFNRASDRVYNLTSVTSFVAVFNSLIESKGNFSFDMPNLKHLQLHGFLIDNNHISKVINHFNTLETVLLNGDHYHTVIECIKQLKYVKEFTTRNFSISQLPSLQQFFENFDITKSKLKKLVFYVRYLDYSFYEAKLNAINIKLSRSNKPTWTLSRETPNFGNNVTHCNIVLSLEMHA